MSQNLIKDVVIRLLQADCLRLDVDRLLDVDPHEWDKKVQTIKAQMSEMSTMLEEKEEEMQNLIKRQTKSDKEREALKNELDDHVSSMETARSDATRAREEAENLAKQMQDMSDRITELSFERDSILQEHEDTESLSEQIAKLAEQLEYVKEEKAKLLIAQSDSEEKARQLDQISAQLQRLSA
eukprot:157196-Rhodomonas_salina.1